MTTSDIALWNLLKSTIRRDIANPLDPFHWVTHYDPAAGKHQPCECEEAT